MMDGDTLPFYVPAPRHVERLEDYVTAPPAAGGGIPTTSTSKSRTYNGGANQGAIGASTFLTATGAVRLVRFATICTTAALVQAAGGTQQWRLTFASEYLGAAVRWDTGGLFPVALDPALGWGGAANAAGQDAAAGTFVTGWTRVGFGGLIIPNGGIIADLVSAQAITAGVITAYYSYEPIDAGATLA